MNEIHQDASENKEGKVYFPIIKGCLLYTSGNMDVFPGQPQDFTHTQRAGKGKVHCHIELAVRAFVQGKTDHIRCPDIPFRILRFREDHIVKGISCNDFPSYRLLKRLSLIHI